MNQFDSNPPSPFVPSVKRGPFTTHNGPWFHWAKDDQFRQGVRLQERHCNSQGIAHGGFLSAFADGLLATAIFRAKGRPSVTVQLTTNFLKPAQAGEWLQGTGQVTRMTRSLVFVEGRAWIGEDEEIPQSDWVFTAQAVFQQRRK